MRSTPAPISITLQPSHPLDDYTLHSSDLYSSTNIYCMYELEEKTTTLMMLSQTNHTSLLQPQPVDNYQGFCQPITLTALLPSIFTIVQCVLLHPTFAHSRLARLIRNSLTPLNVFWWIRLPFQRCFRPMETNTLLNMALGSITITMAIKSLEWGFASQSYYKRPLITLNGVSRWEKVKETDESYKKLQEDEPCDAFKLITWTLLQITSSVNPFSFSSIL